MSGDLIYNLDGEKNFSLVYDKMAGSEFHAKFRIMVVGDKRVGKTSIVERYLYGTFKGGSKATGVDERKSKVIEVDGKKVKLQVIDTVSREWHLSVDSIDFRRADAIFICYDVTSLSSFRDTKYWPNRIGDTNDFELALVATKCDKKSARVVGSEMGEAFAKDLGAHYYETSAKKLFMVDELFYEVGSRLLLRDSRLSSGLWDTITLEESQQFSLLEEKPRSRKRCCH